jgi:hypothetical protein
MRINRELLPFRAAQFRLGDLVAPRYEVSVNPGSAGGYHLSTDDVGVITEIREDGLSSRAIYTLFKGQIMSWGPDDLDMIAHGS